MVCTSRFELFDLEVADGTQKGQRIVYDLRDLSTPVAVAVINCNPQYNRRKIIQP
jgi:hypothetical protein